MSENVQAGLVMIVLAAVIGYTWYIGAWAALLDAVTGQVAAGGRQDQRARAVLSG